MRLHVCDPRYISQCLFKIKLLLNLCFFSSILCVSLCFIGSCSYSFFFFLFSFLSLSCTFDLTLFSGSPRSELYVNKGFISCVGGTGISLIFKNSDWNSVSPRCCGVPLLIYFCPLQEHQWFLHPTHPLGGYSFLSLLVFSCLTSVLFAASIPSGCGVKLCSSEDSLSFTGKSWWRAFFYTYVIFLFLSFFIPLVFVEISRSGFQEGRQHVQR